MEEFKLPRSTLDKLPTATLRGVLVSLLELADENGVVTFSVRALAKSIGMEYQPLRTALKFLYANAIANAVPNAKLTQLLTQITISDIDDYRVCARKQQRKANAVANAVPNASRGAEISPDYILPPYVEAEFADTWRKFIAHRKDIKKPYKSAQSERIAYNKMVELAGHDPAKAKDMVERTILGQWQGLFPEKSNGNNRTIQAATAKTRRDRGLSLATEIVSRSETLVGFYNDCRTDTHVG